MLRLRSDGARSFNISQSYSSLLFSRSWCAYRNCDFLLKQIVQQTMHGKICIEISLRRKQSTFLKKVFPENMTTQSQSVEVEMYARQSQINMIRAPQSVDPTRKMIFCFSDSRDWFACLSSVQFFISHSSLSMMKYAKYSSPIVIISRIPLRITQSITWQLYPRLKEVFSKELPSPTAKMNQVRKLPILSTQMPMASFLVDSLSFRQWIFPSTSRKLRLTQIRRFRMVANTKNSSKRRQQTARIKVCAIESMNIFLSSYDSGLFLSLFMAWNPRIKTTNIAKLISPSKRRKEQTKLSSVQWKIVEYESVGGFREDGFVGDICDFLGTV